MPIARVRLTKAPLALHHLATSETGPAPFGNVCEMKRADLLELQQRLDTYADDLARRNLDCIVPEINRVLMWIREDLTNWGDPERENASSRDLFPEVGTLPCLTRRSPGRGQ